MRSLMPSPTLAGYIARLFASRILGVLLMLVIVLQLLDVLAKSGEILAHPGNGEAQVWTYIGWRMPQLVRQFLPYSVLLATLFTVFPLNQNSEIIAMRAAGLSAHQILMPMLATALVVAGLSFAFNEVVAAPANARLTAWQAVNYGRVPSDSTERGNMFVADGPNILFAQSVTGVGADGAMPGAAMQMRDVVWYARDAGGMITAEIHSPAAHFVAPGWRLTAPVAFTVATTASQSLAPLVVGRGITPRQVAIAHVDGDSLDILALSRVILALRASGRPTAELEGRWWHKLAKPLSVVLMPLLGAVAAFGLGRSGGLLIRAVVGLALGFAYFVIDNAALAMGNFGSYPPLVAAWIPFLLFLAIGETVLIRTEE